jgi:hypothetical protein
MPIEWALDSAADGQSSLNLAASNVAYRRAASVIDAARRLVAPFAQTVPKGQRWYLVYEPTQLEEPGFTAFRGWLMLAARARP